MAYESSCPGCQDPPRDASVKKHRRLLHRVVQSKAVQADPTCDEALLDGDPWTGNEDLAYEGLLEWLTDARRTDPKQPQQEKGHDQDGRTSPRWQGILPSYFHFEDPRDAVGDARQRLCEEIDSLLNRTDQMLQQSPISSKHRQQSRTARSPGAGPARNLRHVFDPSWAPPGLPPRLRTALDPPNIAQLDKKQEESTLQTALDPPNIAQPGKKQEDRRCLSETPKRESITAVARPTTPCACIDLRGMPGPARRSAPQRERPAKERSSSSGSTNQSISSLSTVSSLHSRPRSSSVDVGAERINASFNSEPKRGMSPKAYQVYQVACQNGFIGRSQVTAQSIVATPRGVDQSVRLCDNLVTGVNEALFKLALHGLESRGGC